MKFYSPKKLMRRDQKKLYRLLREAGCGEYDSRKILLEAYSFGGELTLKPASLGLISYLRKKDWLNEDEFANQLELLVKGKKFNSLC